jgi:hypothetical protein
MFNCVYKMSFSIYKPYTKFTTYPATGGQIMDTGFVISSQRLVFADIPDNLLVFQQDMNDTPDTLTIVMKAETGAGSGKKVRASITWQEIV